MVRSCVFECQRVLRPQRGHEAVHELFRGEIKHLALGASVAGPGQGLQQVGLAEPDAGMNVERIEHDRVAAPPLGNLFCGGVSEGVRASDDEGLEGQTRIERGTAESVMHGRDRPDRAAHVAAVDLGLAGVARTYRHLQRLELRRQGADHRGAHREFDAREVRLLGLPAGQHPLGVMGLDPALEKAGWYGQLHRIPFAAVELHASEPARVNIVTDFGAETISHPRPAVLIHARHFVCLFLIGINGWVQRGRNAITSGTPLGRTRSDTNASDTKEEGPRLFGRG